MTALKDVIIIPITITNGTVALWMSVTVGGTTMETILVDIEAGVVNEGGEILTMLIWLGDMDLWTIWERAINVSAIDQDVAEVDLESEILADQTMLVEEVVLVAAVVTTMTTGQKWFNQLQRRRDVVEIGGIKIATTVEGRGMGETTNASKTDKAFRLKFREKEEFC